jgi:hypothetical protein
MVIRANIGFYFKQKDGHVRVCKGNGKDPAPYQTFLIQDIVEKDQQETDHQEVLSGRGLENINHLLYISLLAKTTDAEKMKTKRTPKTEISSG